MNKRNRAKHDAAAEQLLCRWFQDGIQNEQSYSVPSMWTKGRGAAVKGLARAQEQEWIVSKPDTQFDKRGWRHDITPNGRVVMRYALRYQRPAAP